MLEYDDKNRMLGYAFVPVQTLDKVFVPEEGLMRATMFPELYMPFGVYGGGVLND
ncbi:MAG: spore coat associated protein CotJA [Eubacteriales bacterium]|nr:spore coat associated protein CotJA [Eubacteriales bacterium]